MKHALRKYLSSSGSALFMVVSTMAALILLVTAMYLSVVSAGQVQLTLFNQEQAYISSSSMSDMFAAKMIENQSHAVVQAMFKLNKGESISTNGNGFASFMEGGTAEDTEFGAYDVNITRLNDENIGGKTYQVFDIAVHVMNNGVVETSHTYVQVGEAEGSEPPVIDRCFTGTGYTPNDVYIAMLMTDTEMYFDNEYVIFGPHAYNSDSRGNSTTMDVDITCVGSAALNLFKAGTDKGKPLKWVIGNDLTIACNSKIDLFGKADNYATLVVGKDLIIDIPWLKVSDYTNVYVGGDLIITDSNAIQFGKNCNVYVQGDVYIENTNTCDYGNLYVNGDFTTSSGTTPPFGSDTSLKGAVPQDAIDEMSNIMNETIQVNVSYPKWEIPAISNSVDIEFCSTGYDDEIGISKPVKYTHYIGSDCVIEDIKDVSTGVGVTSDFAVVIDTGDDPKGFRYISVEGNVDTDGDGIDDMFMWLPQASSAKRANVLVVGCGTLVIDVPAGVTYQATDQEFFGHIGWFMMMGAAYEPNGGTPYFRRDGYDMGGFANTLRNAGIIYAGDTTNKCDFGITPAETVGTGDDEIKFYECSEHGGLYRETAVDAYDEGNGTGTCPCLGRILKDKVDAFYTSTKPSARTELTDYFTNGYPGPCGLDELLYPNVNVYVVSVNENADIQLARNRATGAGVMNNTFYGYVYAPYMSFVVNGSGGGFKIVGGVVASDMTITGTYEYLFAQPEFRLDYLFADKFDGLTPGSSRPWRYDGR